MFSKRKSRVRQFLIIAACIATAFAIVALAMGVASVTEAEKEDSFCASCHTEPEVTYVNRFAEALHLGPTDLASYHHARAKSLLVPLQPTMRCVDCHQGEGLLGRGIVLSIAAYDALKHLTGTAQQPAKIVFNIQNEACLKCHMQETHKFADKPEKPFIIDNHYHYKYFQPNTPTLQCVACHPAHLRASSLNGFQIRRITIPVCEACHQFQGRGSVKMQ